MCCKRLAPMRFVPFCHHPSYCRPEQTSKTDLTLLIGGMIHAARLNRSAPHD
jgi:hypothetical protein